MLTTIILFIDEILIGIFGIGITSKIPIWVFIAISILAFIFRSQIIAGFKLILNKLGIG